MGDFLIYLLFLGFFIAWLYTLWRLHEARNRIKYLEDGQNDDDDYDDEYQKPWVDTSDDYFDDGWDEVPHPKRVTPRIQINYTDSKGNLTTRIIQVLMFDLEQYGGIFKGFCELRQARRTFKFDRVRNCIDLDSKEKVGDLKSHLLKCYDESTQRVVDKLEIENQDILKMIFFLVKADGRFTKKEKTVVSEYFQNLTEDKRINFDMVEKLYSNMEIPTLRMFQLCAHRFFRAEQADPDELIELIKNLIDTKPTIHPSEQSALDYIIKLKEKFNK